MPYFVYILQSRTDKKLYVGCSNNLERRINDHNNGKVIATKSRKPFDLVHFEKFENKSEAFNRERYLKSLWSSRFKQKILRNYVNKIGHADNNG